MDHGLDTQFKHLTDEEVGLRDDAIKAVLDEVYNNQHKRPKMTTLLEEFSELVLAFRGKHDDPPELELKQVASVAINMLWQLYAGDDVNNIVTFKENK